jgi:hypothetical protein
MYHTVLWLTHRWLLALAAAAASLAGAAAQSPCSTAFTVTLRNFNKAGAGPAGNPDFGFLPEPANVNDRKIVQAVLPASGRPAYRPATGFNTTTTHSELRGMHSQRAQIACKHVDPLTSASCPK